VLLTPMSAQDDLATQVARGIAARKYCIVHFSTLEKLWPCLNSRSEQRKWTSTVEAFAKANGCFVELHVHTARAVFRRVAE
jgi:hypothetical protein